MKLQFISNCYKCYKSESITYFIIIFYYKDSLNYAVKRRLSNTYEAFFKCSYSINKINSTPHTFDSILPLTIV